MTKDEELKKSYCFLLKNYSRMELLILKAIEEKWGFNKTNELLSDGQKSPIDFLAELLGIKED